MNQTVTRQILWNVPTAFVVIMYALLLVLVCCFVERGIFWWRRVTLGTPENDRFDKPLLRLWFAQSRNRSYCCGAGGGCFRKEEVGGSRINETRLTQLACANPETVAVGCPFCMTMMEDAVKSRAPDNSNRVMDLAEIIAEAAGIC
jgi:hypothetical protein